MKLEAPWSSTLQAGMARPILSQRQKPKHSADYTLAAVLRTRTAFYQTCPTAYAKSVITFVSLHFHTLGMHFKIVT